MRCSSKHIPLSFLAIALLVVVSLACSPTGALPGGSQTQPTQPPAAQATSPGGQPTSPPASKPTVAATKPAAAAAKFASADELNSYRLKMSMWFKEGDKKQGPTVTTIEAVKQPPAKHTAMGQIEIITIGSDTWTKIGGKWIKQPPPDQNANAGLSAEMMRQIQDKFTYKELGKETVNGVSCKHYSYSGQATVTIPEGMKGEATVSGKGEMWVADQSGLLPVIIRDKGDMDMTIALAQPLPNGKKEMTLSMYIETELTDINTPITIKPPEGAEPMPGGPATPSVKTPPAPKATAPSAQQPTPVASQGQPTAVPSGKTASFTITGTDVIYLAGRDDVQIPPLDAEDETFPILRCSGDLPETFPASLAVSPGAKLTFKATGEMDFWGGTSPMGPDGEAVSAIDALGGLSGYNGPQGALVGVFLDGANPKDESAPDALDMESLGTEFATLTPALGQVFFIGDGLTGTGSGAAQTFVVPGGATRLFLGIADGSGFGGAPGCYGDNIGAFQVQVNLP